MTARTARTTTTSTTLTARESARIRHATAVERRELLCKLLLCTLGPKNDAMTC